MPAAVASNRVAEAASRLIAATVTAWLFVSAAVSSPAQAGVSTFGRPPELAIAWLLTGAAAAWWLLRAADRASLARRLTLVLLVSTILGQRGVPGDDGGRLALLAAVLLISRPWLVATRASLLTAAALLLAVPSMLGTDFPQGSVLWLSYVLPPAALALLVPSLFSGQHAERVVFVLLLATATLCIFALASYAQLSDGLQLPFSAVFATRLRLLGLHPNLAVPHLVTTLLLAGGLALTVQPRRRPLIALLALPVLVALLAVRSRTGLLTLGFGGALLVWQGLRPRLQARLPAVRWISVMAAVAVALLLVWPVLGASERTALQHDPSMVSKAVSFRTSMWALGRAAFAAAPWHGYGAGTTYVQGLFALPGVYEGLPKDDHPHNVVLAVGEGFGWPGVIALVLLFAGSVAKTRRETPAVHAASAALLSLWAANAIDLGSADSTLYPALAFLLLGLRDAAARDTDAREAAEAASESALATRTRRAIPWVAVGIAVFGVTLTLGGWCERRAAQAIAAVEAARRDTEADLASAPSGNAWPDAALADAEDEKSDEALRWIDRAERLQPFDPNLPLQRARLAGLQQRPVQVLAALESARALFPGSAWLAHQAALVLVASSPDDPRVEAWLSESVRLDPYGPESWRRHLDLSRLSARLDRPDDAFQELFAAVLLNPGSVADLPRSGEGAQIVLHPAGLSQAGIPVARLLQALAERRARTPTTDPDEAARLRLRGIEILQALDERPAADALAQELLADNQLYLQFRTAQSCIADGRIDEAVQRLRAILVFNIFSARCDLLDALSRTTPLDTVGFDAQYADVLVKIADDIDVVFELDSVKRLLRARQRFAERSGNMKLSVRLSDAMDFAER